MKKLDPELIKKANEMLNLVEPEKIPEYLEYFLERVERNKKEAEKYSELHNVDFKTAIGKVMGEEEKTEEYWQKLEYFAKNKEAARESKKKALN